MTKLCWGFVVSKKTGIAIGITVLNVIVCSGFTIAGVVSPASFLGTGYVPNDASMVFALYAAARTIPLTILVLIAALRRSTRTLVVLGILAGSVQLLDAFIGMFQHDPQKTFGPFGIAILQACAVVILHRTRPISTEG
jgi:hypothetical protein